MFAVDEQAQHDKFEEVVESAGILSSEGDARGLFDLAPNHLG